jgi:RsiW-degrading membrane proteinase PrsW (M82 family)
MEAKPQSTDWRSILLVIFGLGGAILAISSAFGILVFLAANENFLTQMSTPILATTLVASTLIAIGLLLLPVAWLSAKRLRGWDFDSFILPPLRPWAWVLIPSVWLLVLVLATLFYNAPGASWYVPFLHFFSIALPVYFVIRIAVNRISLGSSQRAWGVFSVGLTLSPFLAIIGEVTMFALGIIVAAIYLSFNPNQALEVERLVQQINQAPNLDSLVYLLGPYLKNPLTLITALSFLSFLVPIIEESAKSLGVWLVSDRIKSPAQGFALGVLSGAGFALAESLSASLTADSSWGITLSVRAITSGMHMLATGLVGWGIAYARLEKRYLRLVGMALLAMFLHSVWNAGVVFTILGGVRTMLAMPNIDFLGASMTIGGAGLLLVLIVGMFIAFFAINRRLRDPALPASQPLETDEGVHIVLPEEQDNEGAGVK